MKKMMRTFAALGAFFVVAIAVSACGSGSVPSNDVAVVAGNQISKQAFNHWMYVADKGDAEEDGGPVIVPTDPPEFNGCIKQVREQISEYAKTAAATLRADCKELYTSLEPQVMEFLITGYWYQGTAYSDGIKITQADLDKDFKTAKKSSFPTAAEYKEFLTETGETEKDIYWRLRVDDVYSKLVKKHVPTITTALEEKYYKAHTSSFGTPEERDIHLIQTTSKSQIEKAEAALKSGQSWKTVAKEYSTNSSTKDNGGVINNLEQNQEEAAVNKVIFAAPVNKLERPVKGTFGYYLVEVTKITAAVHDSFAKEKSEIKSLLTSQYDTTAEAAVTKATKKQWLSKTKCAAAYKMADCAGYVAPKTTTSTTTTASSAGGTVTSSGSATATGTVSTAATATTAAATTTTN